MTVYSVLCFGNFDIPELHVGMRSTSSCFLVVVFANLVPIPNTMPTTLTLWPFSWTMQAGQYQNAFSLDFIGRWTW